MVYESQDKNQEKQKNLFLKCQLIPILNLQVSMICVSLLQLIQKDAKKKKMLKNLRVPSIWNNRVCVLWKVNEWRVCDGFYKRLHIVEVTSDIVIYKIDKQNACFNKYILQVSDFTENITNVCDTIKENLVTCRQSLVWILR